MRLSAPSFGESTRAYGLGVVLLVVLFGCARGPTANSAAIPVTADSHDDRLGVDDVFEVRVYGEADLSGIYRVSNRWHG